MNIKRFLRGEIRLVKNPERVKKSTCQRSNLIGRYSWEEDEEWLSFRFGAKKMTSRLTRERERKLLPLFPCHFWSCFVKWRTIMTSCSYGEGGQWFCDNRVYKALENGYFFQREMQNCLHKHSFLKNMSDM